jgi:two-component system nitrate/nitrite sensor histidine kinase NarX
MPLNYGKKSVGILNLFLPKDQGMDDDKIRLLWNTAEDIAVALNAARQRLTQHLIEVANAASTERLEIARDLHDTLGQNLGYLHLKLDQILTVGPKSSAERLYGELEQLRDLANESYELVRNTLVILHHSGDHRINELFNAHTLSFTKRTGICFKMEETGEPQSLAPNYLRQLMFAYKEILYNIEKHSGASKINVRLTWLDNELEMSISDNGRGFDQNEITQNGHYGLHIIKERLHSLGGRAEINSSPGQGTGVTLWLPIIKSESEKEIIKI